MFSEHFFRILICMKNNSKLPLCLGFLAVFNRSPTSRENGPATQAKTLLYVSFSRIPVRRRDIGVRSPKIDDSHKLGWKDKSLTSNTMPVCRKSRTTMIPVTTIISDARSAFSCGPLLRYSVSEKLASFSRRTFLV